jgi:hypothetical protein
MPGVSAYRAVALGVGLANATGPRPEVDQEVSGQKGEPERDQRNVTERHSERSENEQHESHKSEHWNTSNL